MFDPAKASKNIKEEFVSYITTSFNFADEDLRRQISARLNEIISQGPYLEINGVFKTAETIDDLIEEDVLSPLFRKLESDRLNPKHVLPLDRPLYSHQVNAIRTIVKGNNAVITTGTGSGKTHCFLIPVINELLREQEAGTLGPGVRALFIYPMNALANDQLKTVRQLLSRYENITFGVYNGDTEQDEGDACRLYDAMHANESDPDLRDGSLCNEILSRQKMKETPPNILFTNYAMLEHLLFRPADDVIFENADFRFVVLDEAHVYSGATGIETAILLRRLKSRISSRGKTQFILTSATLGNGHQDDDDIITFANRLCGAEFTKDNIIRSERDVIISSDEPVRLGFDLIEELADESKYVSDTLDKHGIQHSKVPGDGDAELLYDLIKETAQYADLRRTCLENGKVVDLKTIQAGIGASKLTDTIDFISLCNRARRNGKQLIDAKYHFFVRCLEGAYISFEGGKPRLDLTRKKSSGQDEFHVFEVAICDTCGHYSLVGKNDGEKLETAGRFDPYIRYFYPYKRDADFIEDEEDEGTKKRDNKIYVLCLKCGAIAEKALNVSAPCDCGEEYLCQFRAKVFDLEKNRGPRCGHCADGHYERFYLGNDAATAVLATALYEELPESEYVDSDPQEPTSSTGFSFLDDWNQIEKQKQGHSRQFLVFSDSRQEAAKFAVYLQDSYQEFLRRRGICHIADVFKNKPGPFTVSDYVDQLVPFFSTNGSFRKSYRDRDNQDVSSRKNAWVGMLNEMARFRSQTSLTGLGLLQFRYSGNTPEFIQGISNQFHISVDSARNLMDLLAFEIVKAGAITADDPLGSTELEYLFYSPNQRSVVSISDKKTSTITQWLPTEKDGGGYYLSARLYYVKSFLKCSDQEAYDILNNYFCYLKSSRNPCRMEYVTGTKSYTLPARYFEVLLPNNPEAHWYRCKTCGRISQFHMDSKCTYFRCDGAVDEVSHPEAISAGNHFAELYSSDSMAPLFIKEHTAQLSRKESLDYQEQFIRKDINALSCSTTFELGVDVGDLETVFLRDVPPLPSNYAQRAGRAGRSIDSSAFCLTYAKLSSHDLYYFKAPKSMIGGVIRPPLFKLSNEKIVRRHMYDIALSMFFKKHPEQYNGNDAEKFINQKGYVQFEDWLNSRPEDLRAALKACIPEGDDSGSGDFHQRLGIDDFGWLDDFIGPDGTFTALIGEYESNIGFFNEKISELAKSDAEDKYTRMGRIETSLRNYKHNQLIDFLARGNILPRYGFPVDTVELDQGTSADAEKKLRLTRDLSIAISEYAPSSEVVADGKLYTSRYIKKSWVGTCKKWYWHTAYIAECDVCNTWNYSIVPIEKDGLLCVGCGKKLRAMDFHQSIEPRAGFIAEADPKPVPLSRQVKNYSSHDIYIGNTKAGGMKAQKVAVGSYVFNGHRVEIEAATDDSMLIKSRSDFYVCPVCGYAYEQFEGISGDKKASDSMKRGQSHIKTEKEHVGNRGLYKCECTRLDAYTLHHEFTTDVAKISFPDMDTSDEHQMESVMYAILYAMAGYLNIERQDISVCLTWEVKKGRTDRTIVIYDTVPGGAGHSRRLVAGDGELLYKVFERARGNMGQCSCNPSCYNCLRSYENQAIHDNLDRNRALDFLNNFIR